MNNMTVKGTMVCDPSQNEKQASEKSNKTTKESKSYAITTLQMRINVVQTTYHQPTLIVM